MSVLKPLGVVVMKVFGPILSVLGAIFIPEYIKKVIFITSVDAALFNLTISDIDRLKVLNEHYHLMVHADRLALPVALTKYIWEQAFISKLLAEAIDTEVNNKQVSIPDYAINEKLADESQSVKLLVANLAKNVPYWLQYGSIEERSADISFCAREKMNSMVAA